MSTHIVDSCTLHVLSLLMPWNNPVWSPITIIYDDNMGMVMSMYPFVIPG